jgi:hypothetical protein
LPKLRSWNGDAVNFALRIQHHDSTIQNFSGSQPLPLAVKQFPADGFLKALRQNPGARPFRSRQTVRPAQLKSPAYFFAAGRTSRAGRSCAGRLGQPGAQRPPKSIFIHNLFTFFALLGCS